MGRLAASRARAVTVTARFLHSQPQNELASLLSDRLTRCRSAAVVAGFVTPDGVDALDLFKPSHARKLSRLVIGAGTYRAFEAIDRLIFAGVPPVGVRIHLGHCRLSGGKRNPFHRYRPMLHSKLYLFEMDDGAAAAFVGSHNVTGFALRGLNGEAGVLLEGPSTDPAFAEIRQHIDQSYSQAAAYDPSMKEAYAWWTREFFDGLRAEANDAPKESEPRKTVVVVAAQPAGLVPSPDEVIYFEIAEELSEIRSLDTDVHIHLFGVLPGSPSQALAQLHLASASLSCRTEGLDIGRGSLELDADWSIEDRKRPELKRTIRPFRPATSAGMQQVRVRVLGSLTKRFEYLFDTGRNAWLPDLASEEPVRDEKGKEIWLRVKGLSESNLEGPVLKRIALLEASPESGSFILFSPRRRGKMSG
jgi:hypothetical protein